MGNMSMKLISVNIEGQKHLDKIRELLSNENPDVVCLMECFPDTIDYLADDKYPYRLYVPTYQVDQIEGEGEQGLVASKTRVWGEAIISKYPLIDSQITYLSMDEYGPENLPTHGTDNHIPALILANVDIAGKLYRVGTIHLTWTPKASMTNRQRLNVAELLDLVAGQELVLSGDFNIPRGNDVYLQMARYFQDNIPDSIHSTLDPELHYRNKGQVKKLELVVDYVWSTPKYIVSDLKVISGVSDHGAIVCGVGETDTV